MLVLFVLGSIIGGTDMYLHASTKAVGLNFTTAIYQGGSANSLGEGRPMATKSGGALTSPLEKFGAAINTTFCPDGISLPGYFDVELIDAFSSCSFLFVNSTGSVNATDFKPGQSSSEIVGLETAIQVYSNESDLFRVYDVDGVLFLGPADGFSNVDFKASSIGIKTECQSITSQCNFSTESIQADGPLGTIFQLDMSLLVYNCSTPTGGTFTGWYTLALRAVEITTFPNPLGAPSNSFFYATRVILDVQSPSIQTGKITVLGNDLVQFVNGYWITIQSCNSTILHVNYTFYSNTSSYQIDTTSPAQKIMTSMGQAPFDLGMTIVQSGIQNAAQVAVASSDTYLESFEAQLSRLAISLMSGAFIPVPSLSEAWWETQIVTRIPIPPLVLLEIFLLMYAVFGLALGYFAWSAYGKLHSALRGDDAEWLLKNKRYSIPRDGISAEMLSPEVICSRLTDPASVIRDELFEDSLGSGVTITESGGEGKRSILKVNGSGVESERLTWTSWLKNTYTSRTGMEMVRQSRQAEVRRSLVTGTEI